MLALVVVRRQPFVDLAQRLGVPYGVLLKPRPLLGMIVRLTERAVRSRHTEPLDQILAVPDLLLILGKPKHLAQRLKAAGEPVGRCLGLRATPALGADLR